MRFDKEWDAPMITALDKSLPYNLTMLQFLGSIRHEHAITENSDTDKMISIADKTSIAYEDPRAHRKPHDKVKIRIHRSDHTDPPPTTSSHVRSREALNHLRRTLCSSSPHATMQAPDILHKLHLMRREELELHITAHTSKGKRKAPPVNKDTRPKKITRRRAITSRWSTTQRELFSTLQNPCSASTDPKPTTHDADRVNDQQYAHDVPIT